MLARKRPPCCGLLLLTILTVISADDDKPPALDTSDAGGDGDSAQPTKGVQNEEGLVAGGGHAAERAVAAGSSCKELPCRPCASHLLARGDADCEMTGHHIPVECEHKLQSGSVSHVTTYKMCFAGNEGSNLLVFELFNVMVLVGAYYVVKQKRGAGMQGALNKQEAVALKQAVDSV